MKKQSSLFEHFMQKILMTFAVGADQPPPTPEDAYAAGEDNRLNGATSANCSWMFFRTPELTAAWERGAAGEVKDGGVR